MDELEYRRAGIYRYSIKASLALVVRPNSARPASSAMISRRSLTPTLEVNSLSVRSINTDYEQPDALLRLV
jgi:hypothetical protein